MRPDMARLPRSVASRPDVAFLHMRLYPVSDQRHGWRFAGLLEAFIGLLNVCWRYVRVASAPLHGTGCGQFGHGQHAQKCSPSSPLQSQHPLMLRSAYHLTLETYRQHKHFPGGDTHLDCAANVGSGPGKSCSPGLCALVLLQWPAGLCSVNVAPNILTVGPRPWSPTGCVPSGDAGYTGVGTDSASLSTSAYLRTGNDGHKRARVAKSRAFASTQSWSQTCM